MKPKKNSLTHSQRFGLLWISIGLVLIAAVAFFYRTKQPEPTAETPAEATEVENLLQKEQSFYKERSKTMSHSEIEHLSPRHTSPSTPPQSATTPPPAKKQPLMVELNSADTLTLQLLYGIGPSRARSIVRYRERLGGFVDKEQLKEIYGITAEHYASIAHQLRVDSTATVRIAINSIELKPLAKHPYIEYYQALDIVRLRQQGVRFHSLDDLRAVPSMADSTLQRLAPYLDFSLDPPTPDSLP